MVERRKSLLRSLFDAAVAAAQPRQCLAHALPPPPPGRTVVVGAGKAAAAMAQALESHWQGLLEGFVVTQHGYAVPCARIQVIEAAHPMPDEAGLAAATRMLGMVEGLRAEDLVVALFSGGGSSLLPLPFPGITLADKQNLTKSLLRSGASIHEINCVRRHLSAIKGGRLAHVCVPARVVTLLISDVAGDDPTDIASGPTVPDPSRCADALAVLARHGIVPPDHVRLLLESAACETVKPEAALFARTSVKIIATAETALAAAAHAARMAGIQPVMLGSDIEGDARLVAREMGARALRLAGQRDGPCVLLSGGETTVKVDGGGCGGRNGEFLLALARVVSGHPRIHALAADTDGIDGMSRAAGAFIDPSTLSRAKQLKLDPQRCLTDNDSHGFFEALGDQLVCGPTFTNVNDFRAILIDSLS